MDQQTEHIWIMMARKLSGEATEQDLAELEILLGQDPGGNYSMEVMQDIWNNKAEYDPQYAENKYKELVLRMQRMGIDDERFPENDHLINDTSKSGRNSRKWILLFASVIITLTTAFLYKTYNSPKKEVKELLANNEITTKYGSKSNLVLPDGTKVFLNAGSKLTYDKTFGTVLRVVNLSGEAYFDVVKNTAKPFIIHTRNMDIKVTGTAFNVKCYPEEKETETSLIRGSVEITLKNREEKIFLKPNEKLIIHDDVNPVKVTVASTKGFSPSVQPILTLSHLTLMQESNSLVETSWLENKLVFRSETFEEVAIRMERWFNVRIKFADEKLKTRKFTGVFEKETVSQALNALQLTTSFSYHINRDSIIIYK